MCLLSSVIGVFLFKQKPAYVVRISDWSLDVCSSDLSNLKAADLASTSVLFLATHGLVAGEVGDIGEPGLVFTPPTAASPADDGLLTASEVASLRIGAAWVILSACNTAAGDGRAGAPGLSGQIGRAPV